MLNRQFLLKKWKPLNYMFRSSLSRRTKWKKKILSEKRKEKRKILKLIFVFQKLYTFLVLSQGEQVNDKKECKMESDNEINEEGDVIKCKLTWTLGEDTNYR